MSNSRLDKEHLIRVAVSFLNDAEGVLPRTKGDDPIQQEHCRRSVRNSLDAAERAIAHAGLGLSDIQPPMQIRMLALNGRFAFLVGDYQRAARYFESCVKLQPRSATAWLQLGLALIECRDVRMIDTLLRAVELDPSGPEGLEAARRVFELEENAEQARSRDSARATAEHARAKLEAAAAQIAAANESRERAGQEAARAVIEAEAHGLYLRADASVRAGNRNEAKALFQEYLKRYRGYNDTGAVDAALARLVLG